MHKKIQRRARSARRCCLLCTNSSMVHLLFFFGHRPPSDRTKCRVCDSSRRATSRSARPDVSNISSRRLTDSSLRLVTLPQECHLQAESFRDPRTSHIVFLLRVSVTHTRAFRVWNTLVKIFRNRQLVFVMPIIERYSQEYSKMCCERTISKSLRPSPQELCFVFFHIFISRFCDLESASFAIQIPSNKRDLWAAGTSYPPLLFSCSQHHHLPG